MSDIKKDIRDAIKILRENEPHRDWRIVGRAATYRTGMSGAESVYAAVRSEDVIEFAECSMYGAPKPTRPTCYAPSRAAAAREVSTLWAADEVLSK